MGSSLHSQSNGYTCSLCGVFIEWNKPHHCAGSMTTAPVRRVSEFDQIMSKLNEILAELRRRP